MRELFETAKGEAVHARAAAALLGVSQHTLRLWRKPKMVNGKLQPTQLPFLRMGRTVRYLVADLNAYRAKVRQA